MRTPLADVLAVLRRIDAAEPIDLHAVVRQDRVLDLKHHLLAVVEGVNRVARDLEVAVDRDLGAVVLDR